MTHVRRAFTVLLGLGEPRVMYRSPQSFVSTLDPKAAGAAAGPENETTVLVGGISGLYFM